MAMTKRQLEQLRRVQQYLKYQNAPEYREARIEAAIEMLAIVIDEADTADLRRKGYVR